jgi:hypothetical protein
MFPECSLNQAYNRTILDARLNDYRKINSPMKPSKIKNRALNDMVNRLVQVCVTNQTPDGENILDV